MREVVIKISNIADLYAPQRYHTVDQALHALWRAVEESLPEEKKRYFVVEAQDGGHWVELNTIEYGHNEALKDVRERPKRLFVGEK